jgi:hypothetical protein
VHELKLWEITHPKLGYRSLRVIIKIRGDSCIAAAASASASASELAAGSVHALCVHACTSSGHRERCSSRIVSFPSSSTHDTRNGYGRDSFVRWACRLCLRFAQSSRALQLAEILPHRQTCAESLCRAHTRYTYSVAWGGRPRGRGRFNNQPNIANREHFLSNSFALR